LTLLLVVYSCCQPPQGTRQASAKADEKTRLSAWVQTATACGGLRRCQRVTVRHFWSFRQSAKAACHHHIGGAHIGSRLVWAAVWGSDGSPGAQVVGASSRQPGPLGDGASTYTEGVGFAGVFSPSLRPASGRVFPGLLTAKRGKVKKGPGTSKCFDTASVREVGFERRGICLAERRRFARRPSQSRTSVLLASDGRLIGYPGFEPEARVTGKSVVYP